MDRHYKGINVVWYYDGDTLDELARKATALCGYVRALGAESVSYGIPVYMDSLTASAVRAGAHTPSAQQLARVLEVTKQHGLHVTVRPVIRDADFGRGWRGTIQPADRSRWFASYLQTLEPLLQACQDSSAEQVDIAVELSSLTDDPHWAGLIQQARAVFHGSLGWCANWDMLEQGIVGPPGLDAYGFNYYRPVELGDGATYDDLTHAMQFWMANLPASIDLCRLTLTDVGIAAQSGAYACPADTGDPAKPIDASIQERWIRAAWRAVIAGDMLGMYVRMLDLNHPVPGWDTTHWSRLPMLIFHGAKAVADCFGGELPRD